MYCKYAPNGEADALSTMLRVGGSTTPGSSAYIGIRHTCFQSKLLDTHHMNLTFLDQNAFESGEEGKRLIEHGEQRYQVMGI